MQLTILGCAGSYPSAGNPASGYLVRHGSTAVVMDLGNGALAQLLLHEDSTAIDAFVISHAHADHCIDLLSVYVRHKYSPSAPRERTTVYGPRELPARLARAYSTAGDKSGENPLADVFDFKPLPSAGETVSVGELTLSATRVAHPGEAYAIRIAAGGGGSLVYSGDTGECESLVKLASGADTALFEASFIEPEPSEPPLPADLHMSGTQAGTAARRAGVRQLILTHVVEWNAVRGQHDREVAEARSVFGGEVHLAVVGRTFTIAAAG